MMDILEYIIDSSFSSSYGNYFYYFSAFKIIILCFNDLNSLTCDHYILIDIFVDRFNKSHGCIFDKSSS